MPHTFPPHSISTLLHVLAGLMVPSTSLLDGSLRAPIIPAQALGPAVLTHTEQGPSGAPALPRQAFGDQVSAAPSGLYLAQAPPSP